MKPVIWSKESIVFIQDIYDYISSESEQNANLVIETLFDIGEKLNILPEKNPIEPLFESNLIRFFPKWNLIIIVIRNLHLRRRIWNQFLNLIYFF